MYKFNVEGREFSLATDWSEITLRVYLRLTMLEELREGTIPELYMMMILEALCDVEDGALDDMELGMVNELSPYLTFIQKEPVWPNTRVIKIGEVDYVFPEDLNKIKTGEYISIKTLQEGKTEAQFLPYLLAVILRPGYKVVNEETGEEIWKQNKFDAENIEYRIKLFMDVPVYNLMGPITFFLSGKE